MLPTHAIAVPVEPDSVIPLTEAPPGGFPGDKLTAVKPLDVVDASNVTGRAVALVLRMYNFTSRPLVKLENRTVTPVAMLAV
jgi:hypothetical protein